MEKTSSRIFYFDELRVLAILAVLLCHTGQYFPTTVNFQTSPTVLSIISIGRIGVPLFFMISGALLINKDYTLSFFIKKRISRILIPAIFWMFIGSIISCMYAGFDFGILPDLILNYSFPWFVYGIIGIYIVIPLLNSFIKEYGDKGAEYFIIIWLIFIIALNLNTVPANYKFYVFDNIGRYVGYPVLGYYLANKKFKIYSLPMIVICSIIFLSCALLNIYISYNYVSIIQYYSISLIIETCAIFLVFRYISKYCSLKPNAIYGRFHNSLKTSKVGNLIFLISTASYAIYLMQNQIINFILHNFTIDKFYMIPQTFLLISVLCILIVLILARIPIINRLSGVY